MHPSESPSDETPQYALTRKPDLVIVGDAVTEDVVEVTLVGDPLPSRTPSTVPLWSLHLLPLGISLEEASRMKLARAGMPIPSPTQQ